LFESTIDHTGPMARTVYDCALMLEVLAGPDGLDPRQHAELVGRPYTKLLAGGAKGLRVGVLSEGFGLPESEPDVDALVRDAAQCFTRAGAMVTNVSVKEHAIARRCLLMVTAAGIGPMARDAMGSGWKGLYPMDMAGFYRAHKRERANSLPPLVKAVLLLNRVLDRTGDGLHYARAQNLAREVRAAYDKALDEVDVLVMPTVARRPPKLPPLNPDFATSMAAAEPGPVNTPQFNLTGHPALSVPCGKLDGLPIGMQIVGRVGDDATVLRAGQAFEQLA
jgi:amidase